MAENPTDQTLTFGDVFTDSDPRKVNALAQLFPLIQGEVLEHFVQDLQQNGQLEPVMLGPDGSIIDGRNRYIALRRLNIPIKYIRVEGSAKALQGLILGRNLHRRHLNASQRSFVGARLRELYQSEARAAQAHGKTAPGQTLPEKIPTQETSARVATMMLVSSKSVYEASKLLKTATPQIIEAVESGKIRTCAAKLLVGLPPEKQKEILESDKKTRLASLKKLRKHTTPPPPPPRWSKVEEKSEVALFVFDQKTGVLVWGEEHSRETKEALIALLSPLPDEEELDNTSDFESFSDEEKYEMYGY